MTDIKFSDYADVMMKKESNLKKFFNSLMEFKKFFNAIKKIFNFLMQFEKFNAKFFNVTYSFTPRVEDDDKYLVCMVNHETYTTPRLHAVRLDLNYAPRVEVKLDNKSKLYEHGSAQLFCNVKAKPFENIKIAWYRNGKAITLATSNVCT